MRNDLEKATSSRNAPLESLPGPLSRRSSLLVTVILLSAMFAAIYEGGQASRQRRKVQVLTEQIQQLQRERDEALKRLADSSTRRTPRLPAPPMQATAPLAALPAENLQSTNLYARFKDKSPKLSAEQIETYLTAYGRKASSLLAAWRTSGDMAFLNDAMQKYPNDPQVAFEAAFARDLSPEQRRQWLNAFEKSAPDNALANYLSARDYLKAGQTDQAIQQLTAAAARPQFQDYTLDRMQDNEEAYLAAGYSAAEAKILGSSEVSLPQLSELKQLGLQMVELANSYRKAGDEASAQAVLEMAVGLGQRYGGGLAGDCAISHAVGLVIERNALSAMDPNSPYGDSGHTVLDQLNQINQQKDAITSSFKENEPLLQAMSDQDWISYVDRIKSSGEEAALRWAVGKYGRK